MILKWRYNALDFSTIQYETLTLTLLENQPTVVLELQQKLKYLMVDEYQDTNTIQERILKLLMGEAQNLCVVGDDDQGLYCFRGATIRNILEFPKVPSVIKVEAEGREEWYEENYLFLLSLKKDGLTDWNQVAFLFRSVQSDRAVGLANYLEEKGIPVYSPRSNQFFDREEIKLLIDLFIFYSHSISISVNGMKILSLTFGTTMISNVFLQLKRNYRNLKIRIC